MKANSEPLFSIWLYLTVALCVLLINSFKDIAGMLRPLDDYNTVKGTIIDSHIEYKGPWGGWQFNINYKYVVNEHVYLSNKVHYGVKGSNDKTYAQSYVDKYYSGRTVTVYYSVVDATISVLEPQKKYFQLPTILMLSFIIWIFLLFRIIYDTYLKNKTL